MTENAFLHNFLKPLMVILWLKVDSTLLKKKCYATALISLPAHLELEPQLLRARQNSQVFLMADSR
jgi:hypothetical protein